MPALSDTFVDRPKFAVWALIATPRAPRGGRHAWSGPCNYVELSPHKLPAHVFKVIKA